MKQQPKRNERSRPSAQHAMELHQDNPSQEKRRFAQVDRKSTRLNSSHGYNSYAALCLKKKEHSLQSAESGALEDRIRGVDEILRILQKTANRIEKEECIRRVAERLGISQKRLIERYPELLPKEERRTVRSAGPPADDSRFKGIPEERDLVHLLLQGHLSPAGIGALKAEAFPL